MSTAYPNLHEMFKSEGLCPICMTEMEQAPRYTCSNEHSICYRCKPFFHNCPACFSPLDMELPTAHPSYSPVPATHFVPHPLPPNFHEQHPSASSLNDFIEHERNWFPPSPPADQELKECSHSHLGCGVKVPIHLADLHESRCQFRPHLEEEHLPTDVAHKHDEPVECKYRVVGCKVKTSPWRINIHENYCIYKDRFDEAAIGDSVEQATVASDESNPEELVECKYRKYGCMVNMRRIRRSLHQEKCNYRKYHREEDELSETELEGEYDPDEKVACRWAEHGCRVCPKRSRLETHEERCNYRMEECAFKDNGCTAVFPPSRKYAHEKYCQFGD